MTGGRENFREMNVEKTFTITCYGKTKTYAESERKVMTKGFKKAMIVCDGSERDRYANIYLDLVSGAKHCTDGD